MTEMKCRDTMCVECPYKPENKKHLDEEQMSKIVESGAVFPCHMELKGVVGSTHSGVEIYAEKVDTFVVCKGRCAELGLTNESFRR